MDKGGVKDVIGVRVVRERSRTHARKELSSFEEMVGVAGKTTGPTGRARTGKEQEGGKRPPSVE